MNDSTRLMGPQSLPIGHTLLWYTIDKLLGQGGFGLTYLATDTNLDRKVAIKEYLPSIFAHRDSDHTVSPLTGAHGENYTWGLNSFLNEARTLAQFRHRNIVQVLSVFEEHGTAYMVMEYENGESLDQIFKSRIDSLDQAFFEKLLFPVMDGLEQIHGSGFIHRDIKPGNLYIRSDGSPVLIDFGSARQTSQQNTGEMTTLVSQGYTPLEQYSSNFGDQGPWTDIYSFGASIYHGITGRKPDDALNRSASLLANKPDNLRELSKIKPPGFTRNFCAAIDSALLLKPDERPQSLSHWRDVFSSESRTVTQHSRDRMHAREGDDPTRIVRPKSAFPVDRLDPLPTELDVNSKPQNTKTGSKKKNRVPLVAATLIVASLAGGGAWWMYQKNGDGSASFEVTSAIIQQLPKPDSRIKLQSPVERASNEIRELQVLASLYEDALSLNSNSVDAMDGLQFVLDSYKSLAELSLVQQHNGLRGQLLNAVQDMSANPHAQGQSIVRTLDTKSSSIDVENLLSKNTLLPGERDALIIYISGLEQDDKNALLIDRRVTRLLGKFKAAIVRNCENSEFTKAASMTELAMMINPDDPELKMLKVYFEERV